MTYGHESVDNLLMLGNSRGAGETPMQRRCNAVQHLLQQVLAMLRWVLQAVLWGLF